MDGPKLTIITAVRCDTAEKQRWFAECAESVLAQDFQDWEWVVVDDDSPYPAEPPSDVRVRLFSASRRQGPAACRNTAVRLARTSAVLPLDGDDRLAAGALAALWARWDPKRFTYGDLQLLENGRPGRRVPFPPYSFEKSLDFIGNIPVNALHSVDCWRAAGGWKDEFDAGLEDLEYWISAGAAGFCGQHVDAVTVLYRKHATSRAQRMRVDRRQQEMEQKIRRYHADIFRGEYPMGCCGGRSSGRAGAVQVSRTPGAAAPRRLADNPVMTGGKVWVRYTGKKGGGFHVRGQASRELYAVPEVGATFEVWAVDAQTFRRLGRGKDFAVGVAPPAEGPPPAPVEVKEERYQAPEPALAEIVSVDPVRRAEAETEGKVIRWEQPPSLDDLALDYARARADAVRAALAAGGWTVPTLARALPDELTGIRGVGPVTAEKIVAEANGLWAS